MINFHLFKDITRKIHYSLVKTILSPEKYARFIGVNIGNNNLLGKEHWSSEPYLITVGNHCQLTNCKIFTHGGANVVRHIDHSFDCFGKVVIGDFVYIGSHSLIMPGVTIGNHVLIAAGSIVTKSIPDNMVVAGNPAKIICTIDEYYKKNKKYDIGTKGLSGKNKRNIILSLPDDKFIHK